MPVRFDVEVSLALGVDITADPAGWSWTDITGYCMVREGGVTIRRGRTDWQSRVQPSTCEVLVNNADGRFSRLNPLGAHYGQLHKNTPLRVRACAVGGTLTTRFIGFVSEWPPRWEPRERHFWVPVRADGVLRRIGRSTAGRMSALRRTILASGPAAYWPLEGERGAMSALSGLPSGATMALFGTADFGAFDTLAGSAPTPDLTDAALVGRVYNGSATAWHAETAFMQDSITDLFPFDVYAEDSTSHYRWRLATPVTGADTIDVVIADSALSTVATLVGPVAAADHIGRWYHVAVTAEQSGGNVVSKLYVDGTLADTDTSAGTLNRITKIDCGFNSAPTTSMAHIVVGDTVTLSGAAAAMDGYAGEEAHDRFTRLLAEESVHGATAATGSVRMGAQPVGTFLDVIRDGEAADQGVLYEGFADPLVYQATSERYNLAVDLALNYAAGHVKQLELADDDERTVNDSTVTRTGGASARFEQTDGPLGSDPTTGVGRNDESPTLNLYIDEQALDAASWRVHLGTVNEYHYPTVTLMFHSSSSILTDWLTCDIGSRITVDNMPANPTPDLVDQILEGYTERINAVEWHAGLNLSPYAPNVVGEYGPTDPDGTGTDWYDTTASELQAQFISGTNTSMSVSVTEGPLWTTDTDDFPFDITCSGVVLTVTAISGGSSPQTFTITQTPVNGVAKTLAAGTALSLARTPIYAL
jgi:hypothetical protein